MSTSPQVNANTLGAYVHFDGERLCDLSGCNRSGNDGHESWETVATYARDHRRHTHCIACGVDLGITRESWRGIETAAGLLFACDSHPAGEIRDAVLSVERPEVLEPGPRIEEIRPDVPAPDAEEPATAYELATLTALGNPMDEPYPIHSREALIEAFRAGFHAGRDSR